MKKNEISFSQALDQALLQSMDLDEGVIAFGPGVGATSQVFGTTSAAYEKYGEKRVFDTPVSEQALSQFAAGAALTGLRPVLIHHRFDFMLYSLDAIYNWLSLWNFKSSGKSNMPVVIRAIVGKGWGQGPQHAKNMLSIFSHCPGLRLVVPSSPADAKGLLISSIFSDDPVLFIEERSLHSLKGEVPEAPYYIDLNKNQFVQAGKDLTLVTFGSGLKLTQEIADVLFKKHGLSSEIINLGSLAPIYLNDIYESVKKTGRIVTIENAWPVCGIGSEIISKCTEECFNFLKSQPIKISWPNSHVPMSTLAEQQFYPNVDKTIEKILKIFK